jgi:hypothetical protein
MIEVLLGFTWLKHVVRGERAISIAGSACGTIAARK